VQDRFWHEKPEEELYDLRADPDEVTNLVDSPQHQETLLRLRAALRAHLLEVRDNGFIPEGAAGEGWAASRDDLTYPLEKVLAAADLATRRDRASLPKLIAGLSDPNEILRYWAAMGCLMLKDKAAGAKEALARALSVDASPYVRVVVAEALCHVGQADRGLAALGDLLTGHDNIRIRLQSANALDHLGPVAKPALAALTLASADTDDYVKRSARATAAMLRGEPPPEEGQ